MDRSRVEAIGSERAAAEWILRLGGSVKFEGSKHWNFDYNRVPSAGCLCLEAIDATGLAVTSNGLEHLGEALSHLLGYRGNCLLCIIEGLEALQMLSLSKCKYLHDDGLVHLQHVSKTLLHLDLSYCSGLTHKGLLHHVAALR